MRNVYKPMPGSVYTVRELIEILSQANPDALIILGRNEDECTNYIERVIVSDNLVGFMTEMEDDENARRTD